MPHARRNWLIVCGIIAAIIVVLLAAYSLRPGPRKASKRYPMTGVVMSVNSDAKTLSVANDDIPGFMQPMVMNYTVNDAASLAALKKGDQINATLLSDGEGQWVLEGITRRNKP